MAFFKFRKGGENQPLAPAQPESVELMRRRARYRLTGAVLLVLAGVIGFPWVFDTQPRPISVDIPITIPDKNNVPPLSAQPTAPSRPAPDAAAPATPQVPAQASLGAQEQVVTEAPRQPVAAATPPATPAAPGAEASRAKAALEGKAEADKNGADKAVDKSADKTSDKPATAEARYVVQVGAYTEAGKLREARAKLEKAGLKTYTQEIETKEGKRTRVRVGPFASKAEADKVLHKIKALNLPANLLTL